MSQMDRRAFLKRLLALSAAGVALDLYGCASQGTPAPTLAPKAAPRASATLRPPASVTPAPAAAAPATATQAPAAPTEAAPTQATAAPTAATPSPSPTAEIATMAVARGPGADPAEITRRAIAAVGGIERFVKSGADVIIKPNICSSARSYEYAATTNPEVIAALVSLCLGAGARRVRVMDLPFSRTPQAAYEESGIAKAVTAAGGTMEIMSRLKFQDTPIPQGKSIKHWPIYQDALKTDVLINVPIAKHHSLAGLTLGFKNLMGLVTPDNRGALHNQIYQRLADLGTVIRPTLTVVDAIRILTANGPTGGNLDDVQKLDTIIASTDPVAADAYACTLFPGKRVVGSVSAAAAMGLGEKDLTRVKIAELTL